MTSVHAELFERAGAGVRAVMLDTPFGFQENADELAARTVAYFRDSVGRHIEVASYRDAATASALEYERMCASIVQAGWVFAGPGSPTYAIRQWSGTRVPELLAEKLTSGGIVVFSSAAAVGLGEVALPVYEIYKVGMAPHWIPGLDLLSATGVRAAVIPHYNNAEGGTHDTRFCYMGERRLRVLESMLDDDCGILGVDEHTACIIDVAERTLTVRGRGRVIWRHGGGERHWQARDEVPLDELLSADAMSGASPVAADSVRAADAVDQGAAEPFMDEVNAHRRDASAALAARDPDRVAGAILAMESAVHDWSRDALQSDEQDRARAALRELVVRLAELAQAGSASPQERVAPFVDAMLGLRDRARRDGRFGDADALRDALLATGVSVHDTPRGRRGSSRRRSPADRASGGQRQTAGVLRDSLQLGVAALPHHREHAQVTTQRPERVAECRGVVLLDDEVAEPGDAVRDQRHPGDQRGSACHQAGERGGGAEVRACEVEPAGGSLAVLADVPGKEVLVIAELSCHGGCLLSAHQGYVRARGAAKRPPLR